MAGKANQELIEVVAKHFGVVQKSHDTICLSFCRHPALLLSHRPLRVCSFVAPWLAAKFLRILYHVISGRLLRLPEVRRLDPKRRGAAGRMKLVKIPAA